MDKENYSKVSWKTFKESSSEITETYKNEKLFNLALKMIDKLTPRK
jgi:hypothetical protein